MRSGKSGVPSNSSSPSFTTRRIRSVTSTWWTPSRNRPSNRSPSSRARKSWKSSSFPLWGVAVISRRWRVSPARSWPSLYRFVHLISPPKNVAESLCASSHTTRSQSASGACSFCWTLPSRESLSSRAITRSVSRNQLPEAAASSLSFVRISNRSWKRRSSSSCHCSARLPGQHGLVHGRALVGQGLDLRSVDGQHRIEQVGQPDAVGLGHQPEQGSVAVEAPRPPLLDDLQAGLVVAVEELVPDPPGGARLQVLESAQPAPPSARIAAISSAPARTNHVVRGATAWQCAASGARRGLTRPPTAPRRAVRPQESRAAR